jgi:hypothetical protein
MRLLNGSTHKLRLEAISKIHLTSNYGVADGSAAATQAAVIDQYIIMETFNL